MRGRKPKPTKLHVLHGNPGKRKLNDKEPKPKSKAPRCPAWLGEEAKKEWRNMVKKLEPLGLITEIDHATLEAYCVAYGRWAEAEQKVLNEGTLYKTEKGNVITSPRLWVANKAMEQMQKLASEFGMTPSARSRIKVEKPKEEENPMDAFLKRKRQNEK